MAPLQFLAAKVILTCTILLLQRGDCSLDETENDVDQEVTEYMQKVLSEFREQMTDGFPEYGVPSLDPWKFHNQKIHVDAEMAKLDLHIPHAQIVGLSTFTTERFHVIVKQLLVDSHIKFERIRAEGLYDLDGLFAKLLPLYGNGTFVVHSDHPSIAIVLQLDVGMEEINLKVRSVDVDWSELTLDFENFIDGGEVSTLVQRVLPVVGKRLLTVLNPHLLKLLENALNGFLAEQVKKPSVQEMLKKIIEKSSAG